MVADRNWTEYQLSLEAWRADMEAQLRAEDGWLSTIGLYWLKPGENTLGSASVCDVVLPKSLPRKIGVLDFDGKTAILRVTEPVEVLANGVSTRSAPLQDDHDDSEPTIISIGSVSFYIIRRRDQYGVRVKDSNSHARRAFGGRAWFPLDERFRVQATFHPYAAARAIEVENSAGRMASLANVGTVEFELQGKRLRLKAFAAKDNQLWLIFRDSTSGVSTYGAGRFVYADVSDAGIVDLDFNRAYHPPCAFTHFATCPLPPKENVLPIPIQAGERSPE